ncbi:MAG: glucose-6-phosphate isomerase [Puniceicoccales bacterium]|nr:glucose-6-phosphate isomerase [Puniceicoccales bacterium]
MKKHRFSTVIPSLGFALDGSKIRREAKRSRLLENLSSLAIGAMERLERGAIANGSENRMVGHYWLRAPELAPTDAIRASIEETRTSIYEFTRKVHRGEIMANGRHFTHLLCIGIGGSALGPQLLCDALRPPRSPMEVFFIDNTDPDGFVRCFLAVENHLDRTLVLVTSKSGSTPEPRNALVSTVEFFHSRGIRFADRAIAITGEGSSLHRQAVWEKWLGTFPMWDWVGGRTSITSAVGLLPAALCGVNVEAFLNGAAAMDRHTRGLENNPALLLAQCWYHAVEGKGKRDMVILPYRDALSLFPRYLQQLVMESLGKRCNRQGEEVWQGVSVYGNKGSTDQHAYIQQLRDGPNNFFATFIGVLNRQRFNGDVDFLSSLITASDYLEGFLLGTQAALNENGRQTISITLDKLDAFSLGMLIALYERAVGFYAEFIDINAYDQPGVEAGKKAAARILALKEKVLNYLGKQRKSMIPEASIIAKQLECKDDVEMIAILLQRMGYGDV